ncbi:MAG TPA: LysR family transcriptional regulator [Hyphomicrobium sp.]|jgi:DNA-binding transcriptional LysR family regulator
MDIRQLQYLAALARERHFTRAAAACNVTQPTLSGRIRQLELELEVPIVERGQRYRGLTPEGERVLKWAHVILKNWQAMQEELGHLKDHESGLQGRVIVGGIPSSLPMIPLLTNKIRSIHPGIEFTVLSQSSEEILRGLADFSLDVGITYLDNEPIDGMLASPLYIERYCLFVPETHPLADRASVTWQEASEEPLCLLTPNMQNRRIIDRAFETAKCHPAPRLETNSVINLCSNVRLMGLASIMPQFVLDVLGAGSGIKAIPLDDPKVEHSVGLVVADRDPLSPLIEALREATTKLAPVTFAARA